MKKLAVLFGLLVGLVVCTPAQDKPDKSEGKKKTPTPEFEVSAGYAHRSYEILKGVSSGMNGWYGSVDYNFKRWLGAEGEILGSYRNQGINGNTDIYAFLLGPRVYPFGHRRLSPFGYALLGAGVYGKSYPATGVYPALSYSDASYAWEGGGGVNFYLHKNLGIAAQGGWGHTNFGADNLVNPQTNTGISVGIVYRFSRQ